MEITVKKASEAQILEMKSKPTWGCEVSQFNWHYDCEERSLITEGEVEVSYGGKSVSFGVGDYVVFPAGLSCVWKVVKPVKKHYVFA